MIHTAIDLDRPGKQRGFLQVPCSHNLGGWANVMVPITVIVRGKGPTVLSLGGNHGDDRRWAGFESLDCWWQNATVSI